MINFQKVTYQNVWKILKLTVNEEQRHFVATNTESIVEAYTTITSGNVALPFGIYDDDTLVGFIMFGYGSNIDDDDVLKKIADHSYCIWRFMIDKEYQRKGYGKQAFSEAIRFVKTYPCGAADSCWLSYEPNNYVAKALYSSFGFIETGDIIDNEVVAVLDLRKEE